MPASVIVDDLRSLDPVSYIQTLGLRPEDSYGMEVKEEKQPKHPEELGKSLVEAIEGRGYGSEDAFGFTPSFSNHRVYFAWRKS